MKLLDLTLPTPAENLALDEAVLEAAESTPHYPELLRIWEPRQPMVVLGRSSPIAREVDLEYCQTNGIPVLRRCSGGQSIVTGPGCLMYAVLLDYRQRPELRMLDLAHKFVMEQMRAAINEMGIGVIMQGTSDLTWQGRKFSGNSLRCKRNWMIYHGTMLVDFDVDLIARCLGQPIRQPDYRQGRSHRDFLTQLPTTVHRLKTALIRQWGTVDPFSQWPTVRTKKLVSEKYDLDSWNCKV